MLEKQFFDCYKKKLFTLQKKVQTKFIDIENINKILFTELNLYHLSTNKKKTLKKAIFTIVYYSVKNVARCFIIGWSTAFVVVNKQLKFLAKNI